MQGNYIGTDITGTTSLGNGIGLLWNDASYATVGGTNAVARNIISGNKSAGMNSFTLNTVGYEVIEGNYIGVDVSGTKILANSGVGIRIAGPLNNTIGGTVPGAGNVISGNDGPGIQFNVGNGNGTVIEGNFIGTDSTGTLDLGNQGSGIILNSSGVTIGGTVDGAGNIIAYNEAATFDPGDGINFQSSKVTQDSILSNSIFDNAGLGIDFGNGPTLNHPWPPGVSPNTGPNNYQNYPVLTSSVSDNAGTTIQGSLNGPQGTQFLIQFFSSPTADLSGYGEGETYLGSELVSTPTTGNDVNDVNFTAFLPNVFVLGGSAVTATATDPNGNTSEFATDITALASATVDVSVAYSEPGPTATAYVGDTLAYTLTVTNSSSVDAPGVVVTDTLDSNVTYQSAISSLSGAVIMQTGQTVTASLGTVAANTTATVTVYVTVNPGAAPVLATSGSVANSVTLTVPETEGDTSYTNIGITSGSIDTTVQPAADLVLTSLTASPDGSPGSPLYAGGTLTYTITATNTAGRSAASNVVVTDYLPSNIDPTKISASSSVTGVTPVIDTTTGTVTATFGSLSSGTTVTLTVTVVPLASAVTPGLSTYATVFSTAASGVAAVYDPATANNTSADLTTSVTAAADLSVAITASPSESPLYPGGTITYNITVTNLGPSDAPSVVLTDTIPSDVIFKSADDGGVYDGSTTVTFPAQSLPAAAGENSFTAHVIVSVAASSATPTSSTASVTDSSGLYDPNLSNNQTTSSAVTITPESSMSLALAGPSGTVHVGDMITYTINVSNSGPSDEPDAVVTDTLDPNVTFFSATGGVTPVGDTLTFNLGKLTAGSPATQLQIVVIPAKAAAVPVTGTIANTAKLTGTNYDPNGNPTQTVTTTVNASSDLAITSLQATSIPLVEQTLTFTIKAVNNGPSDATGVVLNDVLPANLADWSFVSATTTVGVTPTLSGNTVTADIPALASKASVVMTVTVTPSLQAVTDSPLSDTASISGLQDDLVDNNTQTIQFTVNPAVDLVTSLSSSPSGIVEVQNNLTYQATVKNLGPSNATNVILVDTLPANVVFVSATGGVKPVGNLLTFTIGSLPVNASATVQFVVSPTTASLGSPSLTNTGSRPGNRVPGELDGQYGFGDHPGARPCGHIRVQLLERLRLKRFG